MPGGTGHAAGAGPQAKESGSDFIEGTQSDVCNKRLSPDSC